MEYQTWEDDDHDAFWRNEDLLASASHDMHYTKTTIPVVPNYRKKGLEVITMQHYGSGGQGTGIRNAVTGMKRGVKVGDKEEDKFFKVVDVSQTRRIPLMLYYDSPEQFENHRRLSVSVQSKQSWMKRQLAYL